MAWLAPLSIATTRHQRFMRESGYPPYGITPPPNTAWIEFETPLGELGFSPAWLVIAVAVAAPVALVLLLAILAAM